jgi:hypothetical protein
MSQTHSDGYLFNINYQCDPDNQASQNLGSRGITTWYDPDGPHTIVAGGTLALVFSGTNPNCYDIPDSCNLCFNAYVSSNLNSAADAVKVQFNINGTDHDQIFLPRNGYGAKDLFDQAYELCNTQLYYDVGPNTFKFINTSTLSSVVIQHIKIFRVYQMKNLYWDNYNACAGYGGTYSDSTYNSGLNPYRTDYPCCYEQCQSAVRSYSGQRDSTHRNSGLPTDENENPYLTRGSSFSWYFDWSTFSSYNYTGDVVCLFNFNAAHPTSLSSHDFVQLDAYLNGNSVPFTSYYLGKNVVDNLYPTYDLTQVSGYNQTGANTITLKNSASNDDVGVTLPDDAINIYRIYGTTATCIPPEHGNWIGEHSDFSNYSDSHSNYEAYDDQGIHYNYDDYPDYDDCYHGDIGNWNHDDTPAAHDDYPAYDDHTNGYNPYSDFIDQA